TLMFDAIGSHGGIVNQMLGDGLMALFGAPLPRADHAERAVRAGLEMLELVAGFDREQKAQGKRAIRTGMGIASGQVIAGYTGYRAARDLHVRRRHRESCRPPRITHEGRRAADPDRRAHARRVEQWRPRRGPWSRAIQDAGSARARVLRHALSAIRPSSAARARASPRWDR